MRAAEISRHFFTARFGQLHVRLARPLANVQHPPLMCFHHSPQSSRVFTEVLKDLGRDRFVYAPDTPGFGDSDAPSDLPEIVDYAAAMGEVMDRLGHFPVDLLGYHTGTSIAVELALRRPQQIRRLVLIGVPIFMPEESERFLSQPWPMPLTVDPSYVASEWNRSVQWSSPGATLQLIARGFVDKMKAGEKAFWGGRAAMLYPLADKLATVTHDILAIGPRDDLWEISPRCDGLIAKGRFESWPDVGFGVFDLASGRVNAAIRSHLDVRQKESATIE